jgi:hypothetical protein
VENIKLNSPIFVCGHDFFFIHIGNEMSDMVSHGREFVTIGMM